MGITIAWRSPAFWSTLAGVASVICGALGAGSLAQPWSAALIGVGGLIIALTGHALTAAYKARQLAEAFRGSKA